MSEETDVYFECDDCLRLGHVCNGCYEPWMGGLGDERRCRIF